MRCVDCEYYGKLFGMGLCEIYRTKVKGEAND